MRTWTSLTVLSLAVVSTLSFPRPDAAYKIPTVGLGARSQYYVLHDDGTYKYGYDTGDGAYESAMANAPGDVSGSFGYKDASGTDVKLEYTANDQGFVVSGDHLPQAPEVDIASHAVTTYDAPAIRSRPATHARPVTPTQHAASSAPVEVAQVRSSALDDGSYSFSYETQSSSRHEDADASNNVRGRFSFVADDSVNRQVQYIAGSETGFIAEGAHLPVGPAVPGAESGIPTGRILPVLSEEEANALAGYSPLLKSGEGSSGLTPADASYKFSFDSDSYSRTEEADADGNIVGSYTYVDEEGQEHTVNFVAGRTTGFLPEGHPQPVASADTATVESSVYSASHTNAGASTHAVSPAVSADTYTSSADSSPIDASYSFSYNAGDSSRSESADPNLNVQGTFSFDADDGITRTVNYVAGSATGFVAEGDHLPVAPDADFGSRIDSASTGVVSTKSASTSYVAPTHRSQPATHARPATPTQHAASSAPVEVAQVRSSALDDGSYSFSYETQSSSRHEDADASNNVRGRFSFVADDDVNREIQYVAGAETGFIAEGAHLPVGPAVPGAESGIPTGRILPVLSEEEANKLAGVSYSSKSDSTAAVATYTSQADSSAPAGTYTSADSSPIDASYSFSYNAGDSSRSESADPNLNVQGTFSFDADDGITRTVNYVAGSATGFVAEGDHLPVAPDADFGSRIDSASTGVVSTKSASTSYVAPTHRSRPATHARPATPTQHAASSAPVEVAQVRSSALDDGSYSFSYETQSSSRHEDADASNNVRGRFSFVADDDVNRQIQYVAGSETGFIAEGAHLPVGPAVPGAESGIPTGRILPVLSEEEANALAGYSPLLKSGEGSSDLTPADASYKFSFDSDSYSRTEEADADGNIVGSYTYVDEEGQEHTVKFVAGRTTGFLPEGHPQPVAPADEAPAAPATHAAVASVYASPSQPSAAAPTRAVSPVAATKSAATRAQSASHTSQVVGDVLLHQYSAVNSPKFGYVFTAVR